MNLFTTSQQDWITECSSSAETHGVLCVLSDSALRAGLQPAEARTGQEAADQLQVGVQYGRPPRG